MSIPQSVAEILRGHVTLEIEGIDRMYRNVYVPQLQREGAWRASFGSIGTRGGSGGAVSEGRTEGRHRGGAPQAVHEARGVLFIGKAQEKTPAFRTERRRNAETGVSYPWLVRSTAMVNHFSVYCVDRDFGPFFLKFCTYFPYTAKRCLNGHESLKRQLTQRGVGYEALDNGVLSCEDPRRAQALCDGLSASTLDALLRKWLRKLPHPYSARDRQAGYRYQVSILQAEFSLTQVLDRPVTGRVFFEEGIRENLDLGRPSQVQLIFDRRVTRRTPGRFRSRVITEGVVPSLHVDYKSSRIKQYHKEGRALRTETTINHPRDFGIGKQLKNLPALRQIGFQANRRLLDVQTISLDCSIGEETFDKVGRPIEVEGQRASALRFGDPRVPALFSVLVLFTLQARGFTHSDLRALLAPLLGLDPAHSPQGRMNRTGRMPGCYEVQDEPNGQDARLL